MNREIVGVLAPAIPQPAEPARGLKPAGFVLNHIFTPTPTPFYTCIPRRVPCTIGRKGDTTIIVAVQTHGEVTITLTVK